MKKILVCEKEEVLLTALEFRLRKQGYEVVQAPDGLKALELIRQTTLDLAVIGTEVKKMSGLDLIREIRQTLEIPIPIILVAPLEEEEEIMQAFRLGVSDFVTKPFKPVELVLRVWRILEQE